MTCGDLMCTPCYRAESFSCRRCLRVTYLLHGLCATCAEDDAEQDLVDVDRPIPYRVSEQGLRALEAADRRARALEDSLVPEGWWGEEGR